MICMKKMAIFGFCLPQLIAAEIVSNATFSHPYQASLLTVGQKLHTQGTNTVYSPLGVFESLSFAQMIMDKEEKGAEELRTFLGHEMNASELSAFHQSIPENTETFSSNFYLLPSEKITIDPAHTAIQSSGAHMLDDVNYEDPKAAAAHINGLVAKDTRGMIKELVKPEDFNIQKQAFSLLSTLFVKLEWTTLQNPRNPFKPETLEFHTSETQSKSVQAFGVKNFGVICLKSENVEAVKLRAKENRWMYVKMHTDGNTVTPIDTEFLEQFNATAWNRDSLPGKEWKSIRLVMPCFKVRQIINVKKVLHNDLNNVMQSYFSNTLVDVELKINKMTQESVLTVDHNGAVGASATGTGIIMKSMPRPHDAEIFFNRPFSYLITDENNGILPLLSGTIYDPQF